MTTGVRGRILWRRLGQPCGVVVSAPGRRPGAGPLGNRPCASRAPVPPVLSGRDQASATPSIAISRRLTDRNGRQCMMRLRHLHGCLFTNPRRRREFLHSPDPVATAWNSAIISPDHNGGCERAFFQWPLINGMVAVNGARGVAVESKRCCKSGLVSFSRWFPERRAGSRILSRLSSAMLSGITRLWKSLATVVWEQSRKCGIL
jgi:hypothetical protein